MVADRVCKMKSKEMEEKEIALDGSVDLKGRLVLRAKTGGVKACSFIVGARRPALSWESRLEIIVDTARGLAYLHEDSNVWIIHRDIKSANILLDERFHPKIADFGMARFFPEGETHVSTRVGGTIGYTALEYAVHGQLTEKADVYSYGIVVLDFL